MILSRRGSSLELAGTFIFIAVVALVGAILHARNAQAASAPTSGNGSSHAALQVNTGQASTGTAPSSPSNPAQPTTADNSGSSTSVVSSSSTTNGTTSSQVTVNGQSVPVPANGSSRKVINTPDGHTTVDISSTNNGSAADSNSSNTFLNVSSTSTTQTGGN